MEGFTFGQKKDKPERLSPNLKPLRTGEAETREMESGHGELIVRGGNQQTHLQAKPLSKKNKGN